MSQLLGSNGTLRLALPTSAFDPQRTKLRCTYLHFGVRETVAYPTSHAWSVCTWTHKRNSTHLCKVWRQGYILVCYFDKDRAVISQTLRLPWA